MNYRELNEHTLWDPVIGILKFRSILSFFVDAGDHTDEGTNGKKHFSIGLTENVLKN
jgi:hypothetical protein